MSKSLWLLVALLLVGLNTLSAGEPPEKEPGQSLKLHWENNILTISGENVPGKEIPVWYLEAYCRPGSTNRDWSQTVIGHTTKLISASEDGQEIKLQCTLKDGVIVDHVIKAVDEGVTFDLTAHNPTEQASLADWAQPCIRVDAFTGRKQEDYLSKCFVFLDGKLATLPTEIWATEARYVPGQVWSPKGVNRDDVNPRPLNPQTPSNGLIGCFSQDDSMILASAWEPYQELFQGVIVCVHSDFRIGGLQPKETKKIRGKIYLVRNDVPELLKQYERDFPEHTAQPSE